MVKENPTGPLPEINQLVTSCQQKLRLSYWSDALKTAGDPEAAQQEELPLAPDWVIRQAEVGNYTDEKRKCLYFSKACDTIFHDIFADETVNHHVVDLAGHEAPEFLTVLDRTFFSTSDESTLPTFKNNQSKRNG